MSIAKVALRLVSFSVYAFLYIPLLMVVVFSFNSAKLNAEWVSFSTVWYVKLFNNTEMLTAAANSLWIALLCSLVATILGTLAGLALHRFRLRLLPVLTILPIILPELLMGVSLVLFFNAINLELGMLTVTLAHIAFCLGFVAVVVRARLSGMDDSLVEAARDLGATAWQAFWRVTLPQILPAVIAGALLAFTLSLDDFVITLFTSGANVKTLPVLINTMIKNTPSPEVNALCSVLMLFTLGLAIVAGKISPAALRGH